MIRGWFYRKLMRFAHRYHWHYAPPCYPDGDTLLWCQWCGLRYVSHRAEYERGLVGTAQEAKKSAGYAERKE